MAVSDDADSSYRISVSVYIGSAPFLENDAVAIPFLVI
jgi:hypothetical protein